MKQELDATDKQLVRLDKYQENRDRIVNELNVALKDLRNCWHAEFTALVIDIRTHETLNNGLRVDAMGNENSSFSISGPMELPNARLFYFDPPIMQVEFTPVPEPCTGALLLLGFVLITRFRKR